jgi:transposase
MQVLYERCVGIDVHKRTVVTTMLVTEASGRVNKRTRTFSTMTADLLALEAWLAEERVEQVAMESTGVYWYPLYNLLEETHHIVLVNPQHRRAGARASGVGGGASKLVASAPRRLARDGFLGRQLAPAVAADADVAPSHRGQRRPREEQRQLHGPPNRDAVLGAKPERLGAHVEDVIASTIAQRRAFRRRRARDAALPLARRYGGVLRRRRAAYVVQW